MEKRKTLGMKRIWKEQAGLARLAERLAQLAGLAHMSGPARLLDRTVQPEGPDQLTDPGPPVDVCPDRPWISFLLEIKYGI